MRIIYCLPYCNCVIRSITTIRNISHSIGLHFYIFPTRTRTVFIFHRNVGRIYIYHIVIFFHLGHLCKGPSIHFTCNIASICTCRYENIIGYSIKFWCFFLCKVTFYANVCTIKSNHNITIRCHNKNNVIVCIISNTPWNYVYSSKSPILIPCSIGNF